MTHSLRTLILLLAPAGLALAQHTGAYVFAGASNAGKTAFTYWHDNYIHAGAGGEKGIGNRFTLGGEAGALISLAETYRRHAAILSFGPALHFFPREPRKLDPFVTGGVSLLATQGFGGMVFWGGGANYWFHNRIGLRLEFRDHVWTPESGETIHFIGGRIGFSFR
jgi:hypothetical protein